jgi:membrane dipeptidase
VEALTARHPDKFAMLRSPAEAKRWLKGGRVLLTLGMENGAPIADDLSRVAAFYARGVRYITLAHSHPNRIADGSYSQKRRWHGLSPFGERVVAEINRLGMMVDVSHLSDESTRAVLAVSRAPVIASHTGLRHFTPGFERNLPDDLALAVAKTGGVIQIAFGGPFIDAAFAAETNDYYRAFDRFELENEKARARGETPKQTVAQFAEAWEKAHPIRPTRIDQVLDQIEHAIKLVGVDHVGIGSDFDGVFGGAGRASERCGLPESSRWPATTGSPRCRHR